MAANPVIIVADASYDHDRRRGSYAVWVSCDDHVVYRSAMIQGEVHSSIFAETIAILHGVDLAIRTFLLAPGRKMVVHSDCQEAIRLLEGDRPGYGALLRRELTARLRSGNHMAEYRHVPGHRPRASLAGEVNDWCDRSAKSVLREHFGRTARTAQPLPVPPAAPWSEFRCLFRRPGAALG